MTLSVLHVTQPTDYGVAGYVARLARDQVGRGWQVSVACPDGGPLGDRVREAGATHLRWQADRRPGPSTPAEMVALRRVVNRVRPDVVHLHSSKAGLAGRLAIRGKRPTVFQPHAWSFLAAGPALRRLTLAWERVAARWTDVTVCCGPAEAEAGRRAGIGGQLLVVPTGIDLGRFAPALDEGAREAARTTLGVGNGPLAVCPGRLTFQKGQDILLGAWPAVRRAVPDAELVLVGGGPLRDALEATGAAGVRFAGEQPVDPWVTAADVVVLPSRYEGLSLALLEALAAGRSVVVTAVGGLEDVLRPSDPLPGAIVALDRADDLAAQIVARLRPSPARSQEEQAARALAEHNHDERLWLDRIAELVAGLARADGRDTRAGR